MINISRMRVIEKSRIEDIIQFYAQLHRASKSGQTLECNCPFHADNKMSMKIKLTEQAYECSICKESGNVLDFVQNIDGCSEADAIQILSDWFHIKGIPKGKRSTKKIKPPIFQEFYKLREYKMIYDGLEFNIAKIPGLAITFEQFELRAAPKALPDSYEKLASQKVFPIRCREGILNGFISPYLLDTAETNYQCCPEDLLSISLFGMPQSSKGIAQSGFAYLVRDYDDAIAMHTAGFTNTVAYCNDVISFAQMDQLLECTERLILIHSDTIRSQVCNTKIAARLNFASIQVADICLSAQNLMEVFHQLGLNGFRRYMIQATRLCQLRETSMFLMDQLENIILEEKDTQSIKERAALKARIISIRNKLNRILSILNNYPLALI